MVGSICFGLTEEAVKYQMRKSGNYNRVLLLTVEMENPETMGIWRERFPVNVLPDGLKYAIHVGLVVGGLILQATGWIREPMLLRNLLFYVLGEGTF